MESILVLLILITLATILIFKLYKKLTYWKRKGVKSPSLLSQTILLSRVWLRQIPLGIALRALHKQLPNEKILGIYKGTSPVLLTNNDDIIKKILIKQFDNFTERGFGLQSDAFPNNIFQINGDDWTVLRQRLSPVFTSGKLKSMFYLIAEGAKKLENYIEILIQTGNEDETKALATKFTLDCVGSCVFGIDVNAFCDGENVYRVVANRLLTIDLKRAIKIIVDSFCPSLLMKFGIEISDPNDVNFFYKLVKYIIAEREGKLKERHDFMDFLVEMKEKGDLKGDKNNTAYENNLKITDKLLTAQAFTFFGAGFEPAAATIAFFLHELACNRNIQEKARREVDEVVAKYNGEITFEALSEMEYLKMIMSETLRKYPIGDMIFRKCVQDCEIIEGLTIEKNTKVLISLLSVYYNPEFYPNPNIFDPERFSSENRSKIPVGAYLPFGGGPRQCIGYRFGKLMTLLAVSTILREYTILKTSKTKDKVIFDSRSFLILVLVDKNGLWVKFEKRNDTISK